MTGINNFSQNETGIGSRLDTNLGLIADSPASSDSANSSLIALIKRLLSKFPALQSGAIPTINTGTIISAGTLVRSTPSVTTTSSNILAANANRKRAIIYNPLSSTSTIYLAFSSTALASDIPLTPGNAWIETPDSGVVHLGVFSAISASGTVTPMVLEWS